MSLPSLLFFTLCGWFFGLTGWIRGDESQEPDLHVWKRKSDWILLGRREGQAWPFSSISCLKIVKLCILVLGACLEWAHITNKCDQRGDIRCFLLWPSKGSCTCCNCQRCGKIDMQHPQFALANLAILLLVLPEVGLSIQATCQSMRKARNTRKRVSMQSQRPFNARSCCLCTLSQKRQLQQSLFFERVRTRGHAFVVLGLGVIWQLHRISSTKLKNCMLSSVGTCTRKNRWQQLAHKKFAILDGRDIKPPTARYLWWPPEVVIRFCIFKHRLWERHCICRQFSQYRESHTKVTPLSTNHIAWDKCRIHHVPSRVKRYRCRSFQR